MSSYARANVRIINSKNKRRIPTWSEMGKQNVQAKEVIDLTFQNVLFL